MAKKRSTAVMPAKVIENSIYVIRGHRVMLDADLARLYEVTTKVMNQAVKRNTDRFPEDFAFQLTSPELESLRSQIVTSRSGHGGRRYLPWAFTEQGVAMLSSVLRSKRAVAVNVEIMRAFVRLRRLMATPGELVEQIRRLAETVHVHDREIRIITRVLEQMVMDVEKPRTKIGFKNLASRI